MRLTSYTDYSLRVLIYLALAGQRRCRIGEIARRYRVSENHLVKVVHGLARGGFIASHRGRGGGLELARPPEAIGLGEVVRYCEGPIEPVECMTSGGTCLIVGACGLADALREACDSFLATLDRYTLADVVRRRRQLARLLALAAAA